MRGTRLAATLGAFAALGHVSPAAADASVKDEASSGGERPDHIRPRGGLTLGGGGVFVPEYDGNGAAIFVSARVGIQFNHYFGIYYQNAPNLLFSQDRQDGIRLLAGFVDQNSILLSLTFGHFFEIAVGPAADLTVMMECSEALAWKKIKHAIEAPSLDLMPCESTTGLHPAADGRVAVHLLGWAGDEAERTGLSFVGEVHPAVVSGMVMVTATGGVGVEWF